MHVKWICRRIGGELIASLFAVNATKTTVRDGTERLYQALIKLSADASGEGFLSRAKVATSRLGGEADLGALLYRDRQEYAVGLHVSVRPP